MFVYGQPITENSFVREISMYLGESGMRKRPKGEREIERENEESFRMSEVEGVRGDVSDRENVKVR